MVRYQHIVSPFYLILFSVCFDKFKHGENKTVGNAVCM